MKRIINTCIILISILFMVFFVIDQWNRLQAFSWTFNIKLLLLSTASIVLLFFLDGYGWHLILKALKQNISFPMSIHIWVMSSMTRYLPGGFWPYVSRASLAKDHGVSISASSVSLYFETLLLATSSLAVGLPALMGAANLPVRPWTAGPALILLGFLMHPRIVSFLKYLPGRLGQAISKVDSPQISALIKLYLYYVIFWVLFGLVFSLFISSFYPIAFSQTIHSGSSIALSFFIGYVVFFFPGGIGIRESTIYLLLLRFFPHEVCLVISITSRLWLILGEFLTVFFVMVFRLGNHKKA